MPIDKIPSIVKPIKGVETRSGGYKFIHNVLVSYSKEGKPVKVYYSWDELTSEFNKTKIQLQNSIKRTLSKGKLSKTIM